MRERRDGHDEAKGVGAGITGASGELIENTGGESGIGGTGHENESQATGRHPDERTLPTPQDVMENNGGLPRLRPGDESSAADAGPEET